MAGQMDLIQHPAETGPLEAERLLNVALTPSLAAECSFYQGFPRTELQLQRQ
jgi:hypothetical protein